MPWLSQKTLGKGATMEAAPIPLSGKTSKTSPSMAEHPKIVRARARALRLESEHFSDFTLVLRFGDVAAPSFRATEADRRRGGLIDVSECQNFSKAFLASGIEPTFRDRGRGVSEGAEEPIEDR